MTLDDLHELGRTNYPAAWRAALAWTREGRQPELEWHPAVTPSYVNIPATASRLDLMLYRVEEPRRERAMTRDDRYTLSTWINPAWRWFHGDNHEIDDHGWCVACGDSRSHSTRPHRLRFDAWFGLPKPIARPLDGVHRLNERFMHVRDHAWLVALGPEPHGTLAHVQANMPGWAELFAFHAFTALWLELPEDEQVVLMDELEMRYVGDACRGRACEAKSCEAKS